MSRHLLTALLATVLLVAAGPASAETVRLATGTSLGESGLLAALAPAMAKATGLDIQVSAGGSAQALDLARHGKADVLLLREQALAGTTDDFASRRVPVMHTDYVLVGASSDPAKAKGKDIALALQRIAASSSVFISRGDQSNSHLAELKAWEAAGLTGRKGGAYRECRCSMADALNIAVQAYAYAITDRGAWLKLPVRGELVVIVEGDKRLLDTYSAVAVAAPRRGRPGNPAAQKAVDWLASPQGQAVIASIKVAGQQVYLPAAAR
jgi:tungstate transport system substrate-binding protein